ncbi:MAG TPA: hypothetical protein VJ742_13360 [Nitrososphaera sp.]|nr:hypothetical protein [Nitrososphaera sp.]
MTTRRFMRKELICDFCNSPDIKYGYPVDDFEQTLEVEGRKVDLGYLGGWAACQECYELIETDQREVLADRSVSELASDRSKQYQVEFRRRLRILHDEFFAMRSGPAVPEDQFIDVSSDMPGVLTIHDDDWTPSRDFKELA